MTADQPMLEKRLWHVLDELRGYASFNEELLLLLIMLVALRFAAFKTSELTQNDDYQEVSSETRKHSHREQARLALPSPDQWEQLHERIDSPGFPDLVEKAILRLEPENPDIHLVFQRLPNSFRHEVYPRAFDAVERLTKDFREEEYGLLVDTLIASFARVEGKQGGGYFTPISVVNLVVAVLAPLQGCVFDPASGSGGMLVEAARYARQHIDRSDKQLQLFGQEIREETAALSRVKIRLNGQSSDIRVGDTLLHDQQESIKRFDYVLASPPFNLRLWSKEKFEYDPRYCLGRVTAKSANYLWVQLIYSALNDTGRAGFLMPNSAGDARFSEMEIRRNLIRTGAVDAILAVDTNLLYAASLAFTIWFLDKGKRASPRADKVLFVDAHNLSKPEGTEHREFSIQQQALLSNLVRLYRSEPFEGAEGVMPLLKELFPDGTYRDVPGLCRAVDHSEIESKGWSLNPRRYVTLAEPPAELETITTPPAPPKQEGPIEVFLAYAHEDEKLRHQLEVRLAPLRRQNLIDVWSDRKISAGKDYDGEVSARLLSARLIILLVTPHFIDSDYCYDIEVTTALDRDRLGQARIVPILVRDCLWEYSPFKNLKFLPENKKPITSWPNRDEAWAGIARNIYSVCEELLKPPIG